MATDIDKIKKKASKAAAKIAGAQTLAQAKEELLKIKKNGKSVNVKEFEEFVKYLYEENYKKKYDEKLKELMQKHNIKNPK